MKNLAIICIFVFSGILMRAQSVNIDSLKYQLSVAKEDTNKVNLLNSLCLLYAWSYADTGLIYAQQQLDLSEKLEYTRGIFGAMQNMSSALTTLGNYPLALDYAFKCLSLAEKQPDSSYLPPSYGGFILPYRELGDYKNSLAYCLKGLHCAESMRVPIDNIFWGVFASVYDRDNQPDSAIKYGIKAYHVNSNWSGIPVILGNSYLKKNNFDSAMFYYRVVIPAAIQGHNEIDIIDCYNGISLLYKNKGYLDSASWYAKRVLVEKVAKTFPLGLLKAYTLLADIYELQNKPDSSLKYLKFSIGLRDSLFNKEKAMAIQNLAFKEQEKQKELKASRLQYQNRLRMYLLVGGVIALLIIAGILFRNNRNKQRAFSLLQKQKNETDKQRTRTEQTLSELRATQSQLIQSEKMASLGELTAGIAHEIQNPLNFVNNFSEVNDELLKELNTEVDKGNIEEVKAIAKDIAFNSEKINHHGKRADAIVKGMLQHSRSSSGQKEPVDINALADEYLRLSYHGLRAKDKSFNANFKTDFDDSIGKVNIIPQDIGRVILNLINNAFYAVAEKKKQNADGYEPTVTVSTKKTNDKVEIKVSDNGNGIPQKVLDKIFQPFFTTKPTGQGTGLGLSLSYDIIKAHGGDLKVETKEGEFAQFSIHLPS